MTRSRQAGAHMKNVLLVYWSHDGHTARVARRICETIRAEGHQITVMPVMEAAREGVELEKFDIIILGCAIRYGKFNPVFIDFVNKNKAILDSKPNSMFNLTAIARNPVKARVEGNVYARKFMENNAWKPKEMKCFAGKVDYPNYNLFDAYCIRLIMMMTKGPTDMRSTTDFTDWEDVTAYAKHCLTLS